MPRLAHRLGLYAIKSELEDLSMKYMERETYQFIKNKLNEKKAEREKFIRDFIEPVKKVLKPGFGCRPVWHGQNLSTPSGTR
jgi:guanosine-3',5'-bis(diphosphate) 3'-pyrophosphohydrolase